MKRGKRQLIHRWASWWREHPWYADVALALMVGVIAIVGTYLVGQNQPDRRALDAIGLVLLATGATALVFRRKIPAGVLISAVGITLLYVLLDYPKGPNFLPMIIAYVTAMRQGRRLVVWAVLAADFVLFPWLPYVLGNEAAPTATEMFTLAGWLLVGATVAELVHIRQQRLLRSREEAARRRASEERLRIARELHDVLGHNISLISVQAGVALHLMDQQPEQARIALSVIRNVSKETLRELRSVLDLLRQGQEEAPRAPSPGLASLSELIARAAAAGLQVHTAVAGDLTGLPTTVDWAAFRIVQEALTNVLRHSGQRAAIVQVSCDEQELTLRIDNEVSNAAARTGNGHSMGLGQGILGMQERAAALGGVVKAGHRPDGGFQVLACLPLAGETFPPPGVEK